MALNNHKTPCNTSEWFQIQKFPKQTSGVRKWESNVETALKASARQLAQRDS